MGEVLLIAVAVWYGIGVVALVVLLGLFIRDWLRVLPHKLRGQR